MACMTRLLTLLLLGALAVSGCGGPQDDAGEPAGSAAPSADQRYPDVLAAELRPAGDGSYDVEVTISSPYDSAERYADGWRVLGPDDTVLGEHALLHDHAGEQPFTRTMTGLTVPDDVEEVTVEGRDREHGYGGATVTVDVPR
jgi:hypothetical protein